MSHLSPLMSYIYNFMLIPLSLLHFILLTLMLSYSYHTNMHMSDSPHSHFLYLLLLSFLDFIHLLSSLYLMLALYTNLPMLNLFNLVLHNMYFLMASSYLHHNYSLYMFMSFMLSYPTYYLPDTSLTLYFHSSHFMLCLYNIYNMFHLLSHSFLLYNSFHLSMYMSVLYSFTYNILLIILHLHMFTLAFDSYYLLSNFLLSSLSVHYLSLSD